MKGRLAGSLMRRSGHSAIEFAIAIIILGLAIVPIFGIFSRSREAAFKSKLSFLALHVARERMEELRQLPFDSLEEIADGEWKQTSGNVFHFTNEYRRAEQYVDAGGTGLTYGGVDVAVAAGYSGLQPDDGSYDYPDDYSRIWTRVSVQEVPRRNYATDPPSDDTTTLQSKIKFVRLKRVALDYYWQEKGEDLETARLKHFQSLSTIIASHNLE